MVVYPMQRVPGQALLVSLGVLSLSNVFTPLDGGVGIVDRWTIRLRGLTLRTVLVPGDASGGVPVIPSAGASVELDRLEDSEGVAVAVPALAVRAQMDELQVAFTSDQYIFFVNLGLDVLALRDRLLALLDAAKARAEALRRRSGAAPRLGSAGSATKGRSSLAFLFAVAAPASSPTGAKAQAERRRSRPALDQVGGGGSTGSARGSDAAVPVAATAVAPPAADTPAEAPTEARPKLSLDVVVAGIVVSLLRRPIPSRDAAPNLLVVPKDEAGAQWQPLAAVRIGSITAAASVDAVNTMHLHGTLTTLALVDQRPTFDWLDPTREAAIPSKVRDLVRFGKYVVLHEQTSIRTRTNAHERARTRTNAHERTRTHTNAHERTRTHTNAHERPERRDPARRRVHIRM